MYEKKLVILAQGDSITDGGRDRDNLEDYNHVLGHGYVQMSAGIIGSEYPSRGIYFINRGIAGDNIDQMTERWQRDCIEIKPDILSILIGINQADDVLYEGKMRLLLEQALNVTDKIMLIQPVSLILEGAQSEIARQNIVRNLQAIVGRLCLEYGLLELKTGELLKKALADNAEGRYWLWDGIHPTPAFHYRIALEYTKLLMASGWLK